MVRPQYTPQQGAFLTPLDFFLWGYLKSKVYATPQENLDDIERRIQREMDNLRQKRPMVRGAVFGMIRTAGLFVSSSPVWVQIDSVVCVLLGYCWYFSFMQKTNCRFCPVYHPSPRFSRWRCDIKFITLWYEIYLMPRLAWTTRNHPKHWNVAGASLHRQQKNRSCFGK